MVGRHQHDRNRSADVVRVDVDAVVRLPDRVIEHVHGQLVGGRNRYSVGGELAEGPRWWRGRLDWPGDEDRPGDGIEVVLELDGGRSAAAVVEPDPAGDEHSAVVHGIGPPPFPVP